MIAPDSAPPFVGKSGPQTITKRKWGLAKTFWIRRSIPKFSVCIVPTMAISGPASRATVTARSSEVRVHTPQPPGNAAPGSPPAEEATPGAPPPVRWGRPPGRRQHLNSCNLALCPGGNKGPKLPPFRFKFNAHLGVVNLDVSRVGWFEDFNCPTRMISVRFERTGAAN